MKLLEKDHYSTGFHETNIIPFLDPDEPDNAFVDVGAGHGVHSRPIAEKGFRVYAFEPDPTRFKVLDRFRPPTLSAYPYAVSDKTRRVRLHVHDASCSRIHSKGVDYMGSTLVQAIRLDDFFFMERVGVIKVDVEGHELAVLRGAMNLLRRDRPRLILECHDEYDKSADAMRKTLLPLGYDCRKAYRPTGRQFSYHLICEHN